MNVKVQRPQKAQPLRSSMCKMAVIQALVFEISSGNKVYVEISK